jgi:hypothetical protein
VDVTIAPMKRLQIRKDAVEWREVDGEVLALGLHSWKYMTTNPSGALLWGALAEGATRDDLVELLLGRFDVDAETAAADVDAYLAQLSALGLLEE